MLEKNKADSRKYFIFKIRDLVHNSFHTLEEKRTESLLQYMGICISTYDELRASLDPTKLKRSYEGLLEGLDYQMQIHPFHKLDLYQNDFSHLHQLINLANEARDKELHNIHRSIVALKKKLEAENLINCYIQCLLTETTFKGMDYLMEALISDLLYAGHSMSHILDFFKRQQQEFLEHNDAEKTIQNLNEFDRKPIPFSIHICFKISSQTQKELALNLIKQQFEIHTNQELGIPHINNDTLIASKEYLALDEFKAIDLAQKEFQSVTELFDMWQSTTNCIRDDLWYYWKEDTVFHKISLNSIDPIKMLNHIDANYKKQLERFLQLRNDLGSNNIRTLERILYTLNSAKSLTTQNRFLNFWSSLEYILYSFPRFTIIEKARVVVPEVFGLFYLKNKLNIFWARLTYCMSNKKDYAEKYPTLQNFIMNCQVTEKDYSTPKVIAYLSDVNKYSAILSELSFHIVLERECREIIMLLTEPEKTSKAIQEYFDGIKHDLNYIYRLRNQLIHSTNDIDDSLEYISFRLYRYVNSVLSTILYYQEKNNLYSITDILISVDATYQDYNKKLSPDIKKKKKKSSSEIASETLSPEDIYRIVRPKYLFIE